MILPCLKKSTFFGLFLSFLSEIFEKGEFNEGFTKEKWPKIINPDVVVGFSDFPR